MLNFIRNSLLNLHEKLIKPCEICGGIGYIPMNNFPGSIRRCSCMIIYRYLSELIIAGIPSDYWSLSLSDLTISKKYIDIIQIYINYLSLAIEKNKGLIFFGPNGVGKTSLACIIGKASLLKGYSVRYFTLSSYIDSIQRYDYERQYNYESGTILIIDELDKIYIKRGSDFVVKTLDESLRRFMGLNKTLILCTNWTPEELEETFGESTISFLKRRSEFLTILGNDFSENIQSTFWQDIKKEFDYYHDNILVDAWELEKIRG